MGQAGGMPDPGPEGLLTWRHDVSPAAAVGLTGRAGGVSTGPYASLNLAGHVGDDPAAVVENRRRAALAVGVAPDRLVFATQVHGADVVEVTADRPAVPPQADALVTRERGTALGMLVADCTPVMLVAPDEGVVGVAHAGRRGMAAGVAARTVGAMRDLGADRVLAWVGPSICPRCYEVPDLLRAEVAAVAPASFAVSAQGTPALDVAAGVAEQLAAVCDGVTWLHGCSRADPGLYSYRRDPTTGRYAGLAWLTA
jgi:polyphenol oxidase